MKKALVLLLGVCFVAMLIGSVAARDGVKPGLRVMKSWSADESNDLMTDPGLRGLYETAAVDTYCIVWYNFEQMNWQGWTRVDNTAQLGNFWHVDDFAGMGGGSYGGYVPLEGTKSMWCGCRSNPSDPYVCGWMRAPGYGNTWNQDLKTAAFAFVGSITLSYKCHYDSEDGYDYTRVQYDAGGFSWQTVEEYSSRGDTTAEVFMPLTQARTKLRFHFTADGAWSDQDGLLNSDGGSIVDSIRVRDAAAYNDYQNFEAAAVGANSAGIWIGTPGDAYGIFGGLKNNLTDKDPCGDNFATQVVWFVGSTEPSSSYPGLYDTPFCTGPGRVANPCQDEMIVSPIINMTKYSTANDNVQNGTIPVGDLPLLAGSTLRFTVYRDLPLLNGTFYVWHVRQWHSGCPGQWLDRNHVYYGPDQDYIYGGEGVSDLVGGSDDLQIAVGMIDYCDAFYPATSNCAAHTPSPWIDNVRFERYKTAGPQWAYRQLDIFQDNFPEQEYVLESYVRCDQSDDINLASNPVIRPGDSMVVDASSIIGGGIAADPTFGGPAVYIHVKASYIGPAPTKPALFGPSLTGSSIASTYNYVSDDGTWTIIQGDSAYTSAGASVKDKWSFDLNDALFTRGYRIDYYFTAKDVAGVETALPRRARSMPPYFEWTCLPTKNSDVLFVDDCTDRGGGFRGGAEDFWVPAFNAVLAPPNNNVDIYDVNGPSSGVDNGPGSRAKNRQLTDQYNKIVWDSGSLESITISDGSSTGSDKSNDCQMLIDWIELSEHNVGLWICGDEIAYDLDGLGSAQATTLMSTYCGVDFVTTSYFDVTGGRTAGGVVNPLLTGDTDGPALFVHSGVPDKFYAYGGCFVINEFDVLEKTANGFYALHYPAYHSTNYYGGIGSVAETPSGGNTLATMWFGFSFQYVRDDVVSSPEDRFEIARDVLGWMQNPINVNITPAATPKSNSLAQNFPNPFNPSTSIKFDMKDKGLVTLKIYNVAGQLVRTLVNGTKDAGSYTITWDGKNDRGGAVASGIYFYKMDTKDFSQTKKMVMLR